MILGNKTKSKFKTVVSLVLFLVFATSATVYSVDLSDEVNIYCDGMVIAAERNSKSVYHSLKENGISLGTYDRVFPGLDAKMTDVDRVIVKRAVNATVLLNGVSTNYMTSASNVGEFLKEKGIKVHDYDFINPPKSHSITENMVIEVETGVRIVTEDVIEIPFETERHENVNLATGLVSVTRYGETGKRRIKTETIYRDGVEVSHRVVSDVVEKEPVTEILDVGAKPNTILGADGNVYTYSKVITCTATAYDASYESNGPWGPITATGKALKSGMVAVDPRVIPLGTKLYIESPDGSWSYGYAVAEDTGGAIKGNKIDLFYPTAQACRQFGRRTAKVYVLE